MKGKDRKLNLTKKSKEQEWRRCVVIKYEMDGGGSEFWSHLAD
jgi:hypothetical protein